MELRHRQHRADAAVRQTVTIHNQHRPLHPSGEPASPASRGTGRGRGAATVTASGSFPTQWAGDNVNDGVPLTAKAAGDAKRH